MRLAAILIALALIAAAPASTTIPDDTYGEGGSKESVENEKHEIVVEMWRDERGIVREQFERDPDGTQYWGFYNGDGITNSVWRQSMIVVRPMPRPQRAPCIPSFFCLTETAERLQGSRGSAQRSRRVASLLPQSTILATTRRKIPLLTVSLCFGCEPSISVPSLTRCWEPALPSRR